MRGERLRKKLSSITYDALAEFCEYRYKLMTEEPGNLCTQTEANIPLHAPFNSSEYMYGLDIGDLRNEPWATICKTDPKALLHPNPFLLSQYRVSELTDEPATSKYAWRVWDAAVGIPATASRGAKILPLQQIPIVRNVNSYWKDVAGPAIQRNGPLGLQGRIIRPTGPWIFDLTRNKDGNKILEAAHVLAHYRGDDKAYHKGYAESLGRTAGRLIQALTEIIVCLAYDLPLDVGRKDAGKPGSPDLYYKTEVKSSSEFASPLIRLPWMNREAPRFDDTLSVMLTTVFIEPHPYGFDTHTGIYTLHDRWTCLPSIVAISGWECIDYIAHQPLGTIQNCDEAPVDYATRAEDLLPPETYWNYLAMAQQTSRGDGKPLFEAPEDAVKHDDDHYNWQYFHDWIESEEYNTLLGMTPTFPCKTCMMVNRRVPGAPIRPKGFEPRGDKKKWPIEWVQYKEEVAEINAIREKAIVAGEVMEYGSKQTSRMRRLRNAGYKRKLEAMRRARLLQEGLRKRNEGRELTGLQKQLVREHLTNQTNEG